MNRFDLLFDQRLAVTIDRAAVGHCNGLFEMGRSRAARDPFVSLRAALPTRRFGLHFE
jgi:hypothetical protein